MGDIDYDPFGPRVMTDPLPLFRELRDRYRAFPLPQYDAYALPRFADVWEVSRDRTRFSIVEGPVSHRERLLVPNAGRLDLTRPDPLTSFSMLDPPRHTVLRGAIAPAPVVAALAADPALAPGAFEEILRLHVPLQFGTGVHFCIGAHAARLEGIVCLQELLARVPEYDVDEAGVEQLPSEFQIGVTAVPIVLPPSM